MKFFSAHRLPTIYPFIAALLLPGAVSTGYPATAAMVIDDLQRTVSLSKPAERIVSLAPHLTELVYSAGAGDKLVGVSRHCDYPPLVSKLPKIADHVTVNYELLGELRPDLILVWSAGLKDVTLAKLVSLYGNVYVSSPTDFRGIAENVLEIATLAGNPVPGRQAASRFLDEIDNIATAYANTRTVKTLYLLWHSPPMTIGDTHWISKTINLCNGVNIFSNAMMDIIQINRESLQLLHPEVVIHSLRDYASRSETLRAMLGLPDSLAIAYVEDDLIQRPSLRIVQSTTELCRAIHQRQTGRNND